MTFRADLHVHSNASPDGLSSLEELAAAAKAAGLDAIAVTDHNLCTPVPRELCGVLMIPGCEVSTAQGHITGLFLAQPLDLKGLQENGLPTGAEAVAEIHRCGGVAVLAHPYQKPGADPAAFPFRPDCVEGANARAAFKVKAANEQAAALADVWSLPSVGGSDAHSHREVGNACTAINCDALTLENLKAAITAGRCHPLLVRNTPRFRKGLSQLGKARRSKNPVRVLKGLAYLGYCCIKDVLGPAL